MLFDLEIEEYSVELGTQDPNRTFNLTVNQVRVQYSSASARARL